MLGPPKSHPLHEPVGVSLDDLVPAGHSYWPPEAKLNLGFVRDWVRDLRSV